MTIEDALLQLDPNDDSHWTTDGLPKVDIIAELTGNKDVSRADITAVDATFNRKSLLPKEQSNEAPQEPPIVPPDEATQKDLDTKIETLKSEVEKLQAQREILNKQIHSKTLELDTLYLKRDVEQPAVAAATAIQTFIEGQIQARAAKVGTVAGIVEKALSSQQKIKSPQAVIK